VTAHSFEDLFHDPTYLAFKNDLYNYNMRRKAIRRQTDFAQAPILEVGCGVSPVLPPQTSVIHSDVSAAAMSLLRNNGSARAAMALDATSIPVADGSIGTLVSSEVLEHIPDDAAALKEFARVLRKDGRLIITVPVHQYFFASDDRAVGHYRRYEVPALLESLTAHGFRDFHVEIIAGLADKVGMLGATTIFTRKSSPSNGERLRGLLPLYRLMNRVYGWIAGVEAKLIPMPLATIVLVRATRR
jgi:SAM-dependent methyltransferase